MSISMSELMSGNLISDIPHSAQVNLEILLQKINLIRAAWAKPMKVTSGFRSMQHHIDIYRTKALRENKTFSMLQVPLQSKHLYGQAVDIEDLDGSLYAWCEANVPLLETVGLWIEKGTKGWVHFQILPPRSGSRFFNS